MLSLPAITLNHHLLVVDSTKSDFIVLREILRTGAFRLSTVPSADQAYQAALQYAPDMLLLGVGNPRIDMVSIVEKLKNNNVTRAIPVLLLTTLADIDDCLDGLRSGADDYITKPYRAAAALERIHAHLPSAIRQPLPFSVPFGAARVAPCDDQQVLVTTVKDYLSQRLGAPPKLADLVEHFSISERRLSLAFLEYEGRTIFDYVRDERMAWAKALLTHEAMSIKAIARTIGFSSAANFSTAFRRVAGVSPSTYRRHAYGRGAGSERRGSLSRKAAKQRGSVACCVESEDKF